VGITSNDIAAQRAMLERGEEKRKADWRLAERERLRDTFAAAALTGLLSNVQRYQNGPLTEQAFEIADFMLKERSRTGQAAADTTPQSRAGTTSQSHEGEFTDTVFKTLVERISLTQSLLDENEQLREAIRRLAAQDATLSVCDGNVTVTLDATLTDEERAAVEWYAGYGIGIHAATLRNLLERLT
jgi:hypothetical protein